MSELAMPDGWNSDSLETFLSFALGGDWGKPADYDDPEFETVYCIRGTEISHWAKTNGSTAVERKIKATSLEKRKLQEGDILVEISGGGPDQPVGRTVVIEKKVLNKFKTDNIICTNFLRMFRPTKFINPKFLNFYLQMFYSSGYINEYQSGSNNLRNLKFKEFLTIDVPFAPIDEQNAIVSELEKYFETVSQIQARLDAIPKLIEKFRQSVLNDAVTGKLTEEWRKDKRYETLDSYEIPASWTVLSIEEVADVKGGKRLPKGEKLVEFDTGYPYIRAGQLKLGTVVNTEEARSSQKYLLAETQKQIESYIVKENDAYITIVGASIGDAGLIPKSSDGANLTENAAKLTNYKKELNPVFLSFWLRSVWIQHEIKLQTKSAAQGKLALHRIKSLPFVYPTYEEQNKIVQSVEQFLAHADQIEKSVATAKARVDHLTQSILHQAFTGNLTAEWREQNPELISGDNSAEALLAKIKAKKQGSGKKKSNKG